MDVGIFLKMHPYRYAKKYLVYDYDNGGRYILTPKECRKRFGERFVRQIIYYNNGYGFLILERIPRMH